MATLGSSPGPEGGGFSREKAEILKTAPRGKDGHPLAPNGERSKLTEDQWAAVRTKAFKRWFGDWIEALKAAVLRGKPVATVRMGAIQARPGERASDAAYRWLEENPQTDIERKGLGSVVFDKKSIEDTLGHGFSGPKLNALTAVRSVIESGAELDASMSFDGKPLMNWVVAAPVEMDGNRHLMFVRIRKDMAEPTSLHRFYVHEIVLQEWVENEETSPFKTGSDPEVFRGKKSGGTGFYLSLARRALAVNPETVSKIVDPNGEPRVVFHGTASEFDTFDENAAKLYWDDEHGFFFETSEAFAKDYADAAEVMLYQSGRNRNAKGRVISAFLDIKNPAEEDFSGEYDTPAEWIDEHFNGRYADDLKSRGHDGAVFTSNGEAVIVAFQPNQIKSATGNNGEFSRGNPSTLGSSPSPESSAVQEALAKMPPLFRKVFEDIEAGDSPAVVMKRHGITERAVTNILNQVRSRLATATAAASPAGLQPVMEGDQFKGGRPDLALSTNPTVAAVDQTRNDSGVPDVSGCLHTPTWVSPLAQFLFRPIHRLFHVLPQ